MFAMLSNAEQREINQKLVGFVHFTETDPCCGQCEHWKQNNDNGLVLGTCLLHDLGDMISKYAVCGSFEAR